MAAFLYKKAKESKTFAVFVVWASLLVNYGLYGAIVPLLPVYVQGFSEAETKPSLLSNAVVNPTNRTTVQCTNNTLSRPAQNGARSRIIGAVIGIAQAGIVIASPFVGLAIDKIGYDIPLFVGYAIQIVVSIGFAFADGVALLFVLRFLQGIGAALINTSSLTIVAVLYQDDDVSRGTMIGYAVCGISVGYLLGPPLGSALYQFGSRSAPFLTFAVLTTCVALLRLCIRIPRVNKIDSSHKEVSPWKTQLRLLMDPYVGVCLLLTILALIGLGFLGATLPYHMLSTMCIEDWMLGVVFLPLDIGVAIGTPFQSWMTRKVGRWIVAFYSYIVTAAPFIAYPFCQSFVELLFPGFPLGVATTARSTAVLPILTYLVDKRYGPWAYGSAYALVDIAIAIAFGAGPLLGGILMPVIGFDGTMYLAAALSLSAILPLAFLRKPLEQAKRDEKTPILAESCEEEGGTGTLRLCASKHDHSS